MDRQKNSFSLMRIFLVLKGIQVYKGDTMHQNYRPLLLVALLLCGCAAHVYHPGAANSFDSDSYDVVLVTHAIIETTKADLANNAFPASIAPNVKTALNTLIKSYDVADNAYVIYHQAALAGTATTALSTAVTNALNDVKTQTTALTLAKAGK